MTQIIITLVAVVLLILVIGFFAMRYLRADDHDDFDDLPEERTIRSRGGDAADHDWRGGGDDRVVAMADHAGRGGKPGRRGGSNGGPDGRDRSGSGRPSQGRSASGRDGRDDREPAGARRGYAGDRGFDDRGFDGPGFDTGGFDSRGVSDRGLSDRGFEGPGQADRGSRGGRGGERPQQPRPAAASGRGKGGDAGGTDWDSMSDIDYWTELASDKPLTTTAQPAGPTAVRPGRDTPPDPRADRGSRPGRADDARTDTGPRAAAGRSGGSSRGADSALPDDSTALLPRRHAPTGPSPVLPAARAGAAAANADSLPSRGGRSAARAARAAAPGRDTGRPAADLGSRGASYPDGRGGPGAGSGLSARGQDPRSQDASLSALARLGTPAGGPGGRQAPLDDDPLTSPSFPAIRSDDSRSYRRTDAPATGGRGSNGSNGSRGPAGYGAPGNGGGAPGNGIPPAQTAAYPTMSRPGAPDPRSAPAPGYDSTRSAARPASWEGGYGQQPPGGPVNGGPVNGSGNGTGPNSYRPAASAAGYQSYPGQPSSPPSGNPYGSYVSAPADSYQASRPNGDGGYGSYVNGAETQAYAQPSAAPAPMHAAPVYENGAPGGTAYPAAGGPGAGYGASWPGGTGYPGQGSAPAGYQGGSPGEPGYPAGHNGNGQHANGHNGNGHNGAGQINSAGHAGPYDHQSYAPPEGSGAAPDQRGYGGHDAGYGSAGYGNYPGY